MKFYALDFIAICPKKLRKTLVPALFLLFSPFVFSQTISGSAYLMPNTEGVYNLINPAQTATWEVRVDGVLTNTYLNTSSVTVKAKDTCMSFINFKVTTTSGKIVRKTVIVGDNVRPVFDDGFDMVNLPCNKLDSKKPTATDNSGKPVTVRLKNYEAQYGMCMMTLTWEAIDACGNIATMQQTVIPTTTDNIPPVFNGIQCVAYSCDSLPAEFPKPPVTDNCSNLVSVTLTKQENTVGYETACKNYGLYLFWEALDACGNSSQFIQTILVRDKVPPKFDVSQVLKIQACSPNLVPEYKPKVKDNCSSYVVTKRVHRRWERLDNCNYKVWDTWLAWDACDNESSAVQELLLTDTIPPKFMMLPNLCVACNMIPMNYTAPMAMDNCTANPSVRLLKITGNPTAQACAAAPYDLTLFWEATDDCGNKSVATQTVNVRAMCGMPPVGGDLRAKTSNTNAANMDKNTQNSSDFDDNVEKNALNMPVSDISNKVVLAAYPNPTTGVVHFNFNSTVAGDGQLEVFDATGKRVENLKIQGIAAGENQQIDFTIPSTVASGLLFYKLSVDNFTVNGKVNYIR